VWSFGLAQVLNRCVAPEYRRDIAAIVMVESAGDRLALDGIGAAVPHWPLTLTAAIRDADAALAAGHQVAIGLGQINTANIARFHLLGWNLFDPCQNLRAAQAVLEDCYAREARAGSRWIQRERAWSCYYSGNFYDGFVAREGYSYVARVGAAFIRVSGN
jgi:type IV secretion system protein VirB1